MASLRSSVQLLPKRFYSAAVGCYKSTSAQVPLIRQHHFSPSTASARSTYISTHKPLYRQHRRFQSTVPATSTPSASTPSASTPSATPQPPPEEGKPLYQLVFTCKICKHRSSHHISQQGYKHGTVLVQCPSCKGRHLMADHLKIFEDKSMTIEDILKEKGQMVKRGTITGGDVELWGGETLSEADAIP